MEARDNNDDDGGNGFQPGAPAPADDNDNENAINPGMGGAVENVGTMTMEEADAWLQAHCSGEYVYYSHDAENHLQQVLHLLQRFPGLAQNAYGGSYLLHHFADHPKAHPDAVLAVYSLYPQAIRMLEPSDDRYPLHVACESGAHPNTVMLLALLYPAALRVRTASGEELPLHLAAYQCTVPSISGLLSLYPESYHMLDKLGYTALDLAFNMSSNTEAVQFLLDNNPTCTPLDKLCFGSEGHAPNMMNKPELLRQRWAMTVPRMRKLRCDMMGFSEHDTLTVINLVEGSPTIRDLHLRLAGTELYDKKQTWDRIGRVVAQNPVLQSLHVEVSFRTEKREGKRFDQAQLNVVRRGVEDACSTDLRSVSLEGFFLADAGASLANFLLVDGLQEMKLIKVKLYDATPQDTTSQLPSSISSAPMLSSHSSLWKLQNSWRRCQLEKVSIINCLLDDESFLVLLEELSHMPFLKDLEVVYSTGKDEDEEEVDDNMVIRYALNIELDDTIARMKKLNITQGIVQILKQGKLQTLSVNGPQVDMEPICKALTPGTSGCSKVAPLRKYQVPASLDTDEKVARFASLLFPGNLTLDKVTLPPATSPLAILGLDKHRINIVYYTVLNRFGRARLATEETPKGADGNTVVELLTSIQDSGPESLGTAQLRYGMLRFAPGIWSTEAMQNVSPSLTG